MIFDAYDILRNRPKISVILLAFFLVNKQRIIGKLYRSKSQLPMPIHGSLIHHKYLRTIIYTAKASFYNKRAERYRAPLFNRNLLKTDLDSPICLELQLPNHQKYVLTATVAQRISRRTANPGSISGRGRSYPCWLSKTVVNGLRVYQCFTPSTLKNQGIYSERATVSHPDSLYLLVSVFLFHMPEILLRGRYTQQNKQTFLFTICTVA